MPTVSVIVPVYKVEAYLERCLKSILNQTYFDFELILVDDGSPDKCGYICDEYKKRDSRIFVIHKENGGLSSARNAGLDIAKGKYFLFVDSDDYIDKNLIKKCVETIEKEKVDCVRFGYKKVDGTGNVIRERCLVNSEYKFFSQKEKIKFICDDLLSYKIPFTAWSCMFDSSIIRKNGLRFASERKIYSEDTFFSTLFSLFSNSCHVISNTFYYYQLNPDSLMGQYKKNNMLQINKCVEWSKELSVLCPDQYLKENFYKIAIAFYKNEIRFKVDKIHIKHCVESIKKLEDKDYFRNQFRCYKKNDLHDIKKTRGWLEFFKEKTFIEYFISFNTFIFKVRVSVYKFLRFLKRKK